MVHKKVINNDKLSSVLIIIMLISIGLLMVVPGNLRLSPASAMSTWTQTSEIDFNNGILNNTTIEGVGENAGVRIDFSDVQHWFNQTPPSRPLPRYAHAMATIWGTDNVLLECGLYNGSVQNENETWVYNLTTNNWIRKNPSTKPDFKMNHLMASIWGTDKVMLIGGYSSNNDTWIYDLSDNTWNQVLDRNSPFSRDYAAMASVYGDDKVVFFSGGGGLYHWNDTWIYDYSNNTWTKKQPANRPFGRAYHAMATIHGTDKVLLFSGDYAKEDTWVYDVSDNTWVEKKTVNRPAARSYHAMTPIWGTDNVLLYGGYSDQYLDDTWVYDLSDNTWTPKTTSNWLYRPPCRGMFGLASVWGTNKAVLFGGLSPAGWLGDTWIYEPYIQTKNGTFVSTPYDTGSRSSFHALSWYDYKPENTSIKLQLRTAATKTGLESAAFVGPDGKTSSFYTTTPFDIWTGHYGDRWIQYKVYFNMNIVTDTPRLKDVEITYNCLPTTEMIEPADNSILSVNNPVFIWSFEDFDSDKQKAFQVLIDDDINFSDIDFDSDEQITAELRWEFPAGTNYTVLPDGTWYWKVRTRDPDGEWTNFSSPWKINIDTHAPTSAPTVPINNGFFNNLITISGIANDPSPNSGLNKIEITIKRLNDNNYWNGSAWVLFPKWLLTSGTSNWTFDSSMIPWLSGVKYSIQSRAVDNCNNVEQSDINVIFTIDTDTPESYIDIPKENTWVNDLNTISGQSIDIGGSDIDKVEISIMCTKDLYNLDNGPKENYYWDGNAWTSKEVWLVVTGTKQWSYDSSSIPWTSGDHYIIHSRATDNTNNVEVSRQGTTFMYDDKIPEKLAIYINNGDEYTGSTSVILSLQAEDIGSGVSQMAFSTEGSEWSDWEPFNTSGIRELPQGDRRKTIYFKVRDYMGNIAEPVYDTIVLDTTPPKNVSIIINEKTKYTNSKDVKLDLTAIDSSSGLGEMSFSFDRITWPPWEPYKTKKSISLSDGDGETKIFFKVRDIVGNTAAPDFDTIILDTTSPHSLSILINNGTSETNLTLVILRLNAIDDISGIDQISLSSDGKNWSAWEEYKEIRSYALSSSVGTKNIYFRVKDSAGNIAEPIFATIIFNSTSPIGNNQSPNKSSSLQFKIAILVIIIIIFLLIIVGMVIIIKRKKHIIQKLLTPGAITIKPVSLPESEIVKDYVSIPVSTTSGKLPTTEPDDNIQQLAAAKTDKPVPVPKLAKSTQVTSESNQQESTSSQTPKLPKLPPATIQTEETIPESDQSMDT